MSNIFVPFDLLAAVNAVLGNPIVYIVSAVPTGVINPAPDAIVGKQDVPVYALFMLYPVNVPLVIVPVEAGGLFGAHDILLIKLYLFFI